MTKNNIILSIIYLISTIIYLVSDNTNIQIVSIFIISSILIINIIEYLIDKNASLFKPILNLLLITLIVLNFIYKPFKANKEVNAKEYLSFVKEESGKLHKLNGKISVIEENGIKFIKAKDEKLFTKKLEYQENLSINNMTVKILSEKTYKTGNYKIYIKNNLTNENQEYILSNNGDIKLSNKIHLKMLNKDNNFKNLGKAIQVEYKYPKSKRNYRQWLYKDYKEFNLNTSFDDPITIIYGNDELDTVYNLEISFTPPYQQQFFYLIMLLSLVFLITPFLKLKNENKLL